MESSTESAPTPESLDSSTKPRWRRFVEVTAAVGAFAVAVPLVVNGFASAVSSSKSSKPSTAAASTGDTTAPTGATPDTAPPANIAQQIVGSVITEPTVSPTTAAAAAESTVGHAHGTATPELPLTRTERKELAVQLESARATAMKYPTVADAEAAGYKMVTTYLPLIGAHYIKASLMDGTFEITQPEMLLYDGTKPNSSIVGLSYYIFSDTEPSPFVGPNDHWHQHIGLCIKDGVVVGGTQLTTEQCAARGGAKAGLNNGWMVHAWVVPGWESPQGVFSPEHPGLTVDLPRS